ncbi:hypothetical protein DOY81_004742 [Sarcophaga bullata]|nr:hypothetical protein DOY81_004742 [Sarcophaga bullata]
MFRLRTLALIVTICLTYSVNAKFPEDPKPCKYGDSDCLTKIIEYFMHEKSQGDGSINLVKLDPLEVNKIVMKQGADSPVNIDLVFTKNNIYGLKSAKVVKVSGFGKDLTQKHEVVLKADQLDLVGDYKVDGKILILPIKGSGTSNITMTNVVFKIRFTGTPMEIDGATYMKLDKLQLIPEPERMIFKIDNLFNGDKALGDNMNLFLNENWADIYKEMRATIASAFGKIFESVIGYPPLNLKPIAPLEFGNVRIQQGEGSPVKLDLQIKNSVIEGLDTAKVIKVKGFGKDMTQKNRLLIHADVMSTVGDYTVDGQILILPIKGNGKSNITMIDVTLKIEFAGVPYEKDGAAYMKVEQLSMEVDTKGMIYKVDNLFNGDKALGDNMNLFLNENWQEIFYEVRESLSAAYGNVLKEIISDVFSIYPYEKYFTE